VPEGTLGSLDTLEIYIILTKKLVVPLKNSEKEMGSLFKIGHFKNVHFSKCEE